MKNLLNILLIACCFSVFVACDDEVDNPYGTESSISIVSANMDFEATASRGIIRFSSASGSVSATARSPWCTAEVSADSVVVTVDQNVSVSGRSTVVVLRSGSDSIQVPVTQRGIVLSVSRKNITTGNEASAESVYFTTNLDVDIKSVPAWITTEMVEDTLNLSLQGNATGHLRQGYIVYAAGAVKDSLLITQADFDTDIAGSYAFNFSAEADGAMQSYEVTLSRTGLRIPAFGINVPMTFDSESCSFSIQSGSYLGKYSGYFLYMAFLAGDYWTAYDTNTTLDLSFSYDEEKGTVGTFSGILGGVPIDGLILEAFSSNQLSENADLGPLTIFYNPSLQRAPASPASESVR